MNCLSGDLSLSYIDDRANELKNDILNTETAVSFSGKAYYISESGDDNNSGTSPDAAWRTLEKASSAPLEAGDALLFERGGLFRGCLTVEQENITVSAYGSGAKPRLYGSSENFAREEYWKNTEYEDLYVFHKPIETDVGLVVFDEGKANSFKHLKKNFGFEGGLDEINEDLQIYYEESEKLLYLCSKGGNPASRFSDIEICPHVSVVVAKGNNLTLDNLCIKYCGGHGVRGANLDGLTVQNCELGWIGGCKQFEIADGRSVRYGNAIEIYVNCKNFKVKHNYFYQVYDAAITHQFFIDRSQEILMENIEYCDNLIEYCNYSIEYALIKQTDATQIMRNVLIENNIMRFAGYGFGGQRPDKDGSSHIKGWDICNEAENFIIKNNIFDRGKYMVVHSSAEKEAFLPIYDNNVYIQNAGGQWGRYGSAPTELKTVEQTEEFFAFDKKAKWMIV